LGYLLPVSRLYSQEHSNEIWKKNFQNMEKKETNPKINVKRKTEK